VQKRISLLVPSRARPKSLIRMLESALETAARPDDLEVVVLFDDDDAESLALDLGLFPVIRLVRPRMGMGELMMECIRAATGDILIMANDDIVIRSKDWDDLVCAKAEQFDDGIYLLYPNDCFKSGKMPTFPIVSRHFIANCYSDALAEYRGGFLDVHIFEIFLRLKNSGYDRIQYLHNIEFEHLHFRTGKSECDDTYASRDRLGDDHNFTLLLPYRKAASERLRIFIESAGETGQQIEYIEKPPVSLPAFCLGIVLDTGLPVRWRLKTSTWFAARQVYRIGLRVVQAVSGSRRRGGAGTKTD